MSDEVGRALYVRDHDWIRANAAVREGENVWSWGRDYGKDILTDINQLAHTKGTDAVTRDCLQRAYAEITRLRAAVT